MTSRKTFIALFQRFNSSAHYVLAMSGIAAIFTTKTSFIWILRHDAFLQQKTFLTLSDWSLHQHAGVIRSRSAIFLVTCSSCAINCVLHMVVTGAGIGVNGAFRDYLAMAS